MESAVSLASTSENCWTPCSFPLPALTQPEGFETWCWKEIDPIDRSPSLHVYKGYTPNSHLHQT